MEIFAEKNNLSMEILFSTYIDTLYNILKLDQEI